MRGTMTNPRQLYLAQFQMSNDGAATANTSLVWPGDHNPAFGGSTGLQDYVNSIVGAGYMSGSDVSKLFSAPNVSLNVTVTPGNPEIVAFGAAPSTSALKIHPLKDVDTPNTIFATTLNYVYNSAIAAGSVPYGQKGFVVVHKGGDAAIFKPDQAQLSGWGGDCNKFQSTVGALTGATPGDCSATSDPTGTLSYSP